MVPSDLVSVKRHFDPFLARYQACFSRRSWRDLAKTYVSGLLSPLERKSIEPIAVRAGVPDRTLRHFIGQASWDEGRLLELHQRHVTQTLGDARSVLVLDSTSFPKKGSHSVGVKRQWCGQLGKEENCQVAVTLTYASRYGHTLLNRRLYLPEEWARDKRRRRKCGVPDGLVFRRSWELGLDMIHSARSAAVPHDWVTGDEEFGQSAELHDLLDQMGERYIFEVRSNTFVWNRPPRLRKSRHRGGFGKRPLLASNSPKARAVKDVLEDLAPKEWRTYEIRSGSKGPLRLRVAWMPVIAVRKRRPGPAQWLLITQTLEPEPQTKYFLSNAPVDTTVEALLAGAFARFTIEQCHEQGKQEVGLGDYETRSWRGWHHHSALALVAHHFLVAQRKRLGEKISRDYRGRSPARLHGGRESGQSLAHSLSGNAPAPAEAQS